MMLSPTGLNMMNENLSSEVAPVAHRFISPLPSHSFFFVFNFSVIIFVAGTLLTVSNVIAPRFVPFKHPCVYFWMMVADTVIMNHNENRHCADVGTFNLSLCSF